MADEVAVQAEQSAETQSQDSAESTQAQAGITAGKAEDETADKSAQSETEGDPNQDQDEEKPKREGGFQKRIRKLSQQRAEAEQAAEYWRKKALGIPEAQKAADAEDKEPEPDKFDTVAEYLKAVREYDRKAITRELEKKLSEREQKAREKTEKEKAAENWHKQVQAATEKYEDFEEVVFNDELKVSEHMNAVIAKDDQGAELAYYLGKHPEESAKIAKLSPVDAAFALGTIKAKIAGQDSASQSTPKTEKPVTKAPAPITPVRKPTSVPSKSIYEAGSYEEYVKLREAQRK